MKDRKLQVETYEIAPEIAAKKKTERNFTNESMNRLLFLKRVPQGKKGNLPA